MFNQSIETMGVKIARTAFKHLGAGPKRLIFLTTLIATAINIQRPDDKFVASIDQALGLSKIRSDRAISSSLSLPVYVKLVIWRDRTIYQREFEILLSNQSSQQEINWAANNIAQKSPEWIRYSEVEKIAKDIVQYFAVHHPAAVVA